MRTSDLKGREARDVRSMFGDLPLIEAKAEMIVYVSASDVETGVPGDPEHCMFSQACKRAFGSRAVLFYPTVAYVDMLDEDGHRIVMRFRVADKTRRALQRFDALHAAAKDAEATFRLFPIPPKATLEAMRKRQRQRTKAIKSGKHTVSSTRSAGSKKAARTRRNKALMGMRVGTPV